MKIEVVRRREELEALREEWDALANEDPRDGFFRSATWFITWMRYVRPDAEPFVIVVRAADGHLVGLAPLCRMTYRDLGFRLRGVGLGGREVVSGDYLDFLSTANARAEVLNTILPFLWEQRSLWDLLILGEVIAGGDLYTALTSWAERNGLRIRQQERRRCPYITLPESFDEYLASLEGTVRQKLRRNMRAILDKQGAQIELYSEPEQVCANLDILFQLHQARWRRENLPGNFGRPGFMTFLREFCAARPNGVQCRLYILRDKEQPVGAHLTFHFGQSALSYQGGWDPESPLARFSPGGVLRAHAIKDAIDQGLRYYDFLRGEEAHKYRLTKTYRNTITLLFAGTLLGRGYLRVVHVKDMAKRFLLRSRTTDAGA